MGISMMFILLATLAPFLFVYLKRKTLAVVQSLLLIGTWIYFIAAMFQTAPAVFSITWSMFYLSLLLAEVAWVMFIIHEVELLEEKRNIYQLQRNLDSHPTHL